MKIRDIENIEELDPFDFLEEVVEKEGIIDIVLEPPAIYIALTRGEFHISARSRKLYIVSTKGDWFEAIWPYSEFRDGEVRPDGKAISILTKDGCSIKLFVDTNKDYF